MTTPSGPATLPDDRPRPAEGRSAPSPPEHRGLHRDQVRLLVADPDGLAHRHFHDLPRHLRPGDLLVVNNSATVPAELDASWERHGRIVVHVGPRLGDQGAETPDLAVVELRTAPDAAMPLLDGRPGDEVRVDAGPRLRLVAPYPAPGSSPTGRGTRLWVAQVLGEPSLTRHLSLHGRPISYGYLAARFPLSDYQTVFAVRAGSSEMPSAGRPFTCELVTRLIAEGITIAAITLHTGLSSQEAGERPVAEWFEVPTSTARLVNATRGAGARVIAVGTTVVRALESSVEPKGNVRPRSGWTELVISPDRPARTVDGIITGWHAASASHIQLIEAVAGSELVRVAYEAAAAEGYLWHEFGDSSLLTR